MKRLLVIVPDKVTDILAKGEYQPRYYNPGNFFEEVHLLLTNDDRPDRDALQDTVGDARLFLYNLPADKVLFLRTLLWRPALLRSWAKEGIALARTIQPQLIRCHGNLLNGFLASEIKRHLQIPYALSMHINPDEDIRGRARTWKEVVASRASRDLEKIALLNANIVLPVYEPIVPYLKRIGVKNYEVVHNVLNPIYIKEKTDYSLHDPVKVISVGRLMPDKFPANLIRATAGLNVSLTVVGDGPSREELEGVAHQAGVGDRVVFVKSLPNRELCSALPEFDIFATHTEYFEIGKAVLEPLLTGLPVVLNKRNGIPVPELQGDFVVFVENTVQGYRDALQRLTSDHALRESLGRKAFLRAHELWAPDKMEARVVQIYRDILEGKLSS